SPFLGLETQAELRTSLLPYFPTSLLVHAPDGVNQHIAADIDIGEIDVLLDAVQPCASGPEEDRWNPRAGEDCRIRPERHAGGSGRQAPSLERRRKRHGQRL